ncbi:DedA family protein [Chitinimonas sp. PSY-7]|uniref:DedA family protein n=1 Tax=Chitinimonas sp. PSY-7 TaxID=3459088 RepID=UPI00404026D1
MDFNLIDIILNLDVFLGQMVNQYGPWIYLILFLVIFCETGLVVMPFLPGDSLLFVAGAIAATGGMNPYGLAACLFTAAILGDSLNYVIGKRAGERLFSNPNSKIFRRDYLDSTKAFYDRHGGKTVALARFLPIVRTFAPFVAGMAAMPYPKFLFFSVLGTLIWVGSLVTLGYQFGSVPFIKDNLSVMVVVVVAISFLPMLIKLVHARLASRRTA